MPGDLILVVDESSSEGNIDGFAIEDNPRFAISALSLPLNLSLSISLYFLQWRTSVAW
jgi:hypothetical protein